ncbi:MAG: hypothetical protein WBW33_34365 [Bryobacteraceae bacterium]
MKRFTLFLSALAIGVFPASMSADAVFAVQSTIAAPGSTGNGLDVFLETTSGLNIAGFAVEVTTTDPFITFTGATTGTATPYIFNGNSVFGPGIGTTGAPSQTYDASDLAIATPTNISGTVGLAHFTFDVANGATTGPFAVSLTTLGNSLSDPNGNGIPITALDNGTITIEPSSSVPEPELGLWAIALGGCLLAFRRKR